MAKVERWRKGLSPSKYGWALLLLIMATAVFLRFYQLGTFPPGLYRDEAFNGLDALGVLNGHFDRLSASRFPLFFPANNGREPAYIYLTALFINWLGRTPLAVRMGAAIVGSATCWLTYKLATEWFNQRIGLLAAWLWAITLWPVHLSRIGFRTILLPFGLALTFWLGILAYRKQKSWLWLLAGMAYGFAFYTYLAVRMTPLLLLMLLIFLWWRGRWEWVWPGLIWFGVGTAVILLPWAFLFLQQPELILGRTGQVSIFSPQINGGDLWGTLWRHAWQGVGLFIWRGDNILRHNPAGRPLFDWAIAIPFLIGLIDCIKQWRKPAAMMLLLWTATMLLPTILAEDTPHFLRAVGLLPAVLIFPAIGLSKIWDWHPKNIEGTTQKTSIHRLHRFFPSYLCNLRNLWIKNPKFNLIFIRGRQGIVLLLAVISLGLTMRDYVAYGRDPEVGLLFETAALELAQQIRDEPSGTACTEQRPESCAETAVYLDRWFWDDSSQTGWPSIPFVADLDEVRLYRPETGVLSAPEGADVVVYGWPFGSLDFVPQLAQPPFVVTAVNGRLARNDLEENSYPLYIRYQLQPNPPMGVAVAHFGNLLLLQQAESELTAVDQLRITLLWEAEAALEQELVAFVHVSDAEGVIGQSDVPLTTGFWPRSWWQPNIIVQNEHTIPLSIPFDPNQHQIHVGVYNPATLDRLFIVDSSGTPVSDRFVLEAILP